ncbi:MAG TPA: hypothetical protein VMT76_01680 [Puia sp.]|nr:hypothetical protein [Puia sp.]
MKRIFFVVLLFTNAHVYPQGWSNFFSQQEADIKYMLTQIAELKVYISEVEKGYDIAKKGLTFIGDQKKGEFDLHGAFFNSLKTVNPAIANYAKVADIISYQLSIISSFKKILQLKNMSAAEMGYLQKIYNSMSIACTKSMEMLIDLVTDDTYQMKDNERLQRIDFIYADMKDKYAFTQSFYNDAALLSAQRQNENLENDFLKKLY